MDSQDSASLKNQLKKGLPVGFVRSLGLLELHETNRRDLISEMTLIRPTAVKAFRERRMLAKMAMSGACRIVVGGQEIDKRSAVEARLSGGEIKPARLKKVESDA